MERTITLYYDKDSYDIMNERQAIGSGFCVNCIQRKICKNALHCQFVAKIISQYPNVLPIYSPKKIKLYAVAKSSDELEKLTNIFNQAKIEFFGNLR